MAFVDFVNNVQVLEKAGVIAQAFLAIGQLFSVKVIRTVFDISVAALVAQHCAVVFRCKS